MKMNDNLEAWAMEELEAIYNGLFESMLDAEHAQDWETYWNLKEELRNFW